MNTQQLNETISKTLTAWNIPGGAVAIAQGDERRAADRRIDVAQGDGVEIAGDAPAPAPARRARLARAGAPGPGEGGPGVLHQRASPGPTICHPSLPAHRPSAP